MATVTTTRTVTVNAAFLREIKEVNLDLWRLLRGVRVMCSDPATILGDRLAFLKLVDELRDQLALHFALEEAYGYFDDPVDVAPQLCERAESLRSEHGELYMLVCDLSDQASELPRAHDVTQLVRQVVDAFAAFDRRFKNHEDRENELILQEYDDDIGVGD